MKGIGIGRKRKGIPEDLSSWLQNDMIQSWDPIGTGKNTAQVHPEQFTKAMIEIAQEHLGDSFRIIYGRATSISSLVESDIELTSSSDSEGMTTKITYITQSSSSSTEGEDEISIFSNRTIVALGPWTPTLLPQFPITSLRAHSITLDISNSPPIPPYALFTSITLPSNPPSPNHSTPPTATPEIYTRPNNQIYICGPTDQSPLPLLASLIHPSPPSITSLQSQSSLISPLLHLGTLLKSQACYLPLVNKTESEGPLIGPVPGLENVWIGTGHSCWGVCNSTGTGYVLAGMVLGDGGGVSKGPEGEMVDVRGLDPGLFISS